MQDSQYLKKLQVEVMGLLATSTMYIWMMVETFPETWEDLLRASSTKCKEVGLVANIPRSKVALSCNLEKHSYVLGNENFLVKSYYSWSNWLPVT
jgi:hypothetical protein